MTKNTLLSKEQTEELLVILQNRFSKNKNRHPDLEWNNVQIRLKNYPDKLKAIYYMEETGGEPDVIGIEPTTSRYIFYDCSKESPKGRRSVCYDDAALESRTKFKPENSAVAMATKMGIELLTEEQYEALQNLGDFDTKTSSWLATPPDIRERGGAIFGDKRFGRYFIYHNGAESYYAARGFRGRVNV